MPRPPRNIVPGQPLHIVQRGNNRCLTFADAEDFGFYRRLLFRVASDARCQIHAFVLMTNHLHLLATPEDSSGPPRLMKSVSETYARYFNHLHARTGTLWEGRYRSTPVDSVNYFFACSRYIELNPLRAHIVARPQDYRWSSFAQNAESEPKDLVTPHQLYHDLGLSERARRAAYRAMFAKPLEDSTLEALRYLIAHRTRAPEGRARTTRAEVARRRLRGPASAASVTPG